MSIDHVTRFIRDHRSFLITVHANVDGDALGSELAFARLLKKLGKSSVCVNDDTIPYGYGFLPGIAAIKRYRPQMRLRPFDAAVVLDCSDLRRTGKVQAVLGTAPVLNIDHHVSNAGFGAVSWVDPRACCCCQLIYGLYKRMDVPIDRQSALFLYTGILTDTGSFRYSNTTPATHAIAAELLATGVQASKVYKEIYSSVPYEDMQALGRILPTMQSAAGGRVIWFELTGDLFPGGRQSLSFDLSESILNFARSIKGVEVVVLFKENPSNNAEVRVNFRSQGKTDVNKLAGLFGGGGHPTAAGTTIRGKSLSSVRKLVIAKVKASLPK